MNKIWLLLTALAYVSAAFAGIAGCSYVLYRLARLAGDYGFLLCFLPSFIYFTYLAYDHLAKKAGGK